MAVQMKPMQQQVAAPVVSQKPKEGTIHENLALALMVDEFVKLKLKLDEVNPEAKAAAKLQKELQLIAMEGDPAVRVEMDGQECHMAFTAQESSREIVDMQGLIGALKAKIGYPALIGLIKINLGDVDKYLSEVESAPFIGTKPGSRKLDGYFVKKAE